MKKKIGLVVAIIFIGALAFGISRVVSQTACSVVK